MLSVVGYLLDLLRNEVEGKQNNEADRDCHVGPERKRQFWTDTIPSIVLSIYYLAHAAQTVREVTLITINSRLQTLFVNDSLATFGTSRVTFLICQSFCSF